MGVYASLKVMDKDAQVLSNIIWVTIGAKFADSHDKFVKPEDYHTTLLYSRTGNDKEILPKTRKQYVAKIKDIVNWNSHDLCTVILLDCPELKSRHKYLMTKHRLEYDYDDYVPHVTICYDIQVPNSVISKLKKILVDKELLLSGECIEDLDEDHTDVTADNNS